MRFQKMIIIIGLFLSLTTINTQGQDVICYQATLGIMISESLELYPNNRFKWTSEYDLGWSEYGIYESDGKYLTLKFYRELETPNRVLSESEINTPEKTEILMIDGNRLFRLNKRGRKIKRKRDRSFNHKGSWLFGHKYKILKKEQALKRYWVGEIGTSQLAHHQMIEVTKDKIYLYDLDVIVDSLNRNELNNLTHKDDTYKGRLRLLGNDKLLVKSLVKKTNRKPCNIFFAKKATELNCSTETKNRFEDRLSVSYTVITEEGVFYAMTQVESIADKSKYKIQKAKFLKIKETYFLQPIDKGSNKNIMVPIIEITDKYFLVFDWELNEMIKILLKDAE